MYNLNKYALKQIDSYVKNINMNRSTFLVKNTLKQVRVYFFKLSFNINRNITND